MGQHSNSGRNASLDEKKRRAAGRDAMDRDFDQPYIGRGRTKGAFGKEGQPETNPSELSEGGGGGGGSQSLPKD